MIDMATSPALAFSAAPAAEAQNPKAIDSAAALLVMLSTRAMEGSLGWIQAIHVPALASAARECLVNTDQRER
jgi:hypothetical protein